MDIGRAFYKSVYPFYGKETIQTVCQGRRSQVSSEKDGNAQHGRLGHYIGSDHFIAGSFRRRGQNEHRDNRRSAGDGAFRRHRLCRWLWKSYQEKQSGAQPQAEGADAAGIFSGIRRIRHVLLRRKHDERHGDLDTGVWRNLWHRNILHSFCHVCDDSFQQFSEPDRRTGRTGVRHNGHGGVFRADSRMDFRLYQFTYRLWRSIGRLPWLPHLQQEPGEDIHGRHRFDGSGRRSGRGSSDDESWIPAGCSRTDICGGSSFRNNTGHVFQKD